MMNLVKRLMVAAAAVAAVAGAASAQSLKVDVPFPFLASGKAMPAGSYEIERTRTNTSTGVFRIVNTDEKRSILALSAGVHESGPGAYSDTKLVFKCAGDSCSLAQIWTGSAYGAYDFSTPKATPRESAMVEIRATRVNVHGE